MRRSFVSLCLLVILIPRLHSQNQVAAPTYPQIDFRQQQIHKVIRVVDGDTFLVDVNGTEEKVRLIGVDTPETVHPSKPVQEYGKEASRFTKNLLTGEEVYLLFEKGSLSRDKYQRLLAYVYRAPDGLFVNLELVRQGYAHAYTRYPFEYMDLFREYERRAREADKGLWGDSIGTQSNTESSSSETDASDSSSTPTITKQGQNQEQTVYVTRSGKRYHKEGCSGLSKSKIPTSLKEAKKKYAPCPMCKPPK